MSSQNINREKRYNKCIRKANELIQSIGSVKSEGFEIAVAITAKDLYEKGLFLSDKGD